MARPRIPDIIRTRRRPGTSAGARVEPGRDPEPELPPDPFPDWHQFADWMHYTAAHSIPATGPYDPGCPPPLKDPVPDWFALQCA